MTSAAQSGPMPAGAWRIRPEGDRCLVVALGSALDAAVSLRCLAAAARLRQAALPGVTDIVPGLASVAVHYLPPAWRDTAAGDPYDALAAHVDALLHGLDADAAQPAHTVDIPVRYGGGHGPDLADVAQACGLTPQEVIDLHAQPGSRVHMLGFAPGHPYIGVHDIRLALPRRAEPRTAVPAGSVAIANRQTVIYPQRLPGGWHIIGATPLCLFDPMRQPPALLAPGDFVRFVSIDDAQFQRLREEREGRSPPGRPQSGLPPPGAARSAQGTT